LLAPVSDARTNEELTEKTASGLRWVTLARIATELLLVASMVVLARMIPPGAFGMFAVAVIVQELAVNVPSEGVGSALVQRRTVERAHLQAGLAFNLLLGLGLAVVTLLLSFVLVQPIFGTGTAQLVALTTPWFLMGAIVAVPLAQLRRNLDFRRTSMLGLVQSGTRSIASVVFAVAFGLEAGMFAMLVLALVFAPIPLPRWRTSALRDLLSYGGPASIASIAWVGFRNGDYAIIGAKLGTVQAGYYWRGFQLAVEYQAKISSMMSQMAFPVLARTVGPEEMFALRRRMVRLLTVVVFPPLTCLVILAPKLIPWLFGPDWEPAVLPTQILAGAGAATVVIDAVGTVLMASGRSRAMLGYGVAHFVVYVVAVLIAASYGLTAVCCAAVGVHLVFTAVAYQVLLRSRADRVLRFIWDDMSAAVTGCAVLAAAAWPAYALLTNAGAPTVIVLGAVTAVAAIAYLGTLAIWFPADARDLRSLIRRVVPTARIHAVFRRVAVPAGRSS
jgi:O-antigen/teichoic acid export membrane protein